MRYVVREIGESVVERERERERGKDVESFPPQLLRSCSGFQRPTRRQRSELKQDRSSAAAASSSSSTYTTTTTRRRHDDDVVLNKIDFFLSEKSKNDSKRFGDVSVGN